MLYELYVLLINIFTSPVYTVLSNLNKDIPRLWFLTVPLCYLNIVVEGDGCMLSGDITMTAENLVLLPSFDYGEKFWIIKCKSFTCTCGAETCRYSETTIKQTLDNYNKRLLQDELLMQQSELKSVQ